jgi:hypothetical protein
MEGSIYKAGEIRVTILVGLLNHCRTGHHNIILIIKMLPGFGGGEEGGMGRLELPIHAFEQNGLC